MSWEGWEGWVGWEGLEGATVGFVGVARLEAEDLCGSGRFSLSLLETCKWCLRRRRSGRFVELASEYTRCALLVLDCEVEHC